MRKIRQPAAPSLGWTLSTRGPVSKTNLEPQEAALGLLYEVNATSLSITHTKLPSEETSYSPSPITFNSRWLALMSSAIFHIQVYVSVTKEEAVRSLLQKAQAVAR